MFTNLVRIEQIRFFKSRFFMIGAAVSTIAAALFVLFIRELIHTGTIDLGSDGIDDPIFYQYMAGSILNMTTVVMIVLNTAFFVCDYYQFRLGVNISGAVRNRYKLLAADFAGLFINVLIINTVITVLIELFGFFDGVSNILVVSNLKGLLFVFIGYFVSYLQTAFKAYAIAKIFRRKSLTVIFYYAINFIEIIVLGLIAGDDFLTVSSTGVSTSITLADELAAFVGPGPYITITAFSDETVFSLPVLFMIAIAIDLFIMLIATIADGRRREL